MTGAASSRYAAALADVAIEEGTTERVKTDLASLAAAWSCSADLRNVLESPAVSRDSKHRIIETISARMELTTAVRNFAYLLVDHRRTELLGEMQRAFDVVLKARLGIAEAQITSAGALSASEREQLTRALEERTGKKIEATFREDASLLGGAVVRVGSTVYDGSVREQLTRLQERLERE